MEKKKLLIMASLFWPQKNGGGPPISIMNIVEAIKKDFSIYIISNNHEVGDKEPLEGVVSGWNEFEFGKVYYVPYGKHDVKTILGIMEEVSPDIIYQNSFFSHDDVLPLSIYKKKHKEVKVVVAPRGEFYPERLKKGYAKKNIYKCLFKYTGLLKGFYWQATGEQELGYIRDFIGVKRERIYDVNNITIADRESSYIEKEPEELKLVFIARIHPMKNVLLAIKILEKVKANVSYDIYGSIEDAEYWEECKKQIEKLPENIKVTYCGQAPHEEVCRIIEKHHAYFMPTIGENYGHSIVESFMSKRPVIISDKTPWRELEKYGAGYDVSLNDLDKFIEAIEKMAATDNIEFKKLSDSSRDYIDKKLNNKEVIEGYKRMLS